MAFNLVIQLQARGPTNLSQIVSGIQSRLRNVRANVDVRVNPASVRNLQALNQQLVSVRANLQALGATSRATAAATTNVGRTAATTSGRVQRLAVASRSAAASFRTIGTGARAAGFGLAQFAEQSALATRRFLAFSIAAGAIIRLVQGIREGISQAVEFEREMIRVAQVSNQNVASTRALQREISNLSIELGTSSTELARVSVILRQTGLSTREVQRSLRTLAETDLAPNFRNMQETAEGFIAAMAQFQGGVRGGREALQAMNAVASEFAVESTDLIQAVRRAGGAFSNTGGDVRELIALFTSVRSTTRESAEAIATGLRTIFTRLQRRNTVEALQDLGINLRRTSREVQNFQQNNNLEGQFVGAFEAIRRISEGLASIPRTDARFSSIVEVIGGFRQVSRVIPLINQFRVAQEALSVARESDNSLTQDAQKAQEALGVQFAKLGQQYSRLFRTLTESAGFKALAQGFLTLGRAAANLTEALTPLLPLLIGVASVRLFAGIGRAGAAFGSRLTAPTGGAPITRQTGGFVPGPRGQVDTQLARLSPGEYVINPQAVQAIGVGTLDRLNRIGATPGTAQVVARQGVRPQRRTEDGILRFARGGFVSRRGLPRYQDGGPTQPVTGTQRVFSSTDIAARDAVAKTLRAQGIGAVIQGDNVVVPKAQLAQAQPFISQLSQVRQATPRQARTSGVERLRAAQQRIAPTAPTAAQTTAAIRPSSGPITVSAATGVPGVGGPIQVSQTGTLIQQTSQQVVSQSTQAIARETARQASTVQPTPATQAAVKETAKQLTQNVQQQVASSAQRARPTSNLPIVVQGRREARTPPVLGSGGRPGNRFVDPTLIGQTDAQRARIRAAGGTPAALPAIDPLRNRLRELGVATQGLSDSTLRSVARLQNARERLRTFATGGVRRLSDQELQARLAQGGQSRRFTGLERGFIDTASRDIFGTGRGRGLNRALLNRARAQGIRFQDFENAQNRALAGFRRFIPARDSTTRRGPLSFFSAGLGQQLDTERRRIRAFTVRTTGRAGNLFDAIRSGQTQEPSARQILGQAPRAEGQRGATGVAADRASILPSLGPQAQAILREQQRLNARIAPSLNVPGARAAQLGLGLGEQTSQNVGRRIGAEIAGQVQQRSALLSRFLARTADPDTIVRPGAVNIARNRPGPTRGRVVVVDPNVQESQRVQTVSAQANTRVLRRLASETAASSQQIPRVLSSLSSSGVFNLTQVPIQGPLLPGQARPTGRLPNAPRLAGPLGASTVEGTAGFTRFNALGGFGNAQSQARLRFIENAFQEGARRNPLLGGAAAFNTGVPFRTFPENVGGDTGVRVPITPGARRRFFSQREIARFAAADRGAAERGTGQRITGFRQFLGASGLPVPAGPVPSFASQGPFRGGIATLATGQTASVSALVAAQNRRNLGITRAAPNELNFGRRLGPAPDPLLLPGGPGRFAPTPQELGENPRLIAARAEAQRRGRLLGAIQTQQRRATEAPIAATARAEALESRLARARSQAATSTAFLAQQTLIGGRRVQDQVPSTPLAATPRGPVRVPSDATQNLFRPGGGTPGAPVQLGQRFGPGGTAGALVPISTVQQGQANLQTFLERGRVAEQLRAREARQATFRADPANLLRRDNLVANRRAQAVINAQLAGTIPRPAPVSPGEARAQIAALGARGVTGASFPVQTGAERAAESARVNAALAARIDRTRSGRAFRTPGEQERISRRVAAREARQLGVVPTLTPGPSDAEAQRVAAAQQARNQNQLALSRLNAFLTQTPTQQRLAQEQRAQQARERQQQREERQRQQQSTRTRLEQRAQQADVRRAREIQNRTFAGTTVPGVLPGTTTRRRDVAAPSQVITGRGGQVLADPLAAGSRVVQQVRAGQISPEAARQQILTARGFSDAQRARILKQIDPSITAQRGSPVDQALRQQRAGDVVRRSGLVNQVNIAQQARSQAAAATRRDISALSVTGRTGPAAQTGVSIQTSQAIATTNLARAEAATKNQLIRAERALVNALLPNAGAIRKNTIVRARVDQALRGLVQVATDAQGRILGTATSVGAAARAGVSITNPQPTFTGPLAPIQAFGSRAGQVIGAGGRAAGGFFRGVGGAVATPFRAFNQSRTGQFLSSRFAGAGLGAFLALPAISAGARQVGGTAEEVARGSRSASTFTAAQGTSGFLTGAVTGAFIGGSIPGAGPLGAVIGGVTGGLIAMTTSIENAAKRIREAKIARATEELTAALKRLAGNALSGADELAALRTLRERTSEGAARATSNAEGGFFNNFFASPSRARRLESEALIRELRNEDTQLAEQFSTAFQSRLNSQIRDLVQRNPDTSVEQVRGQIVGNELNQDILALLATRPGFSESRVDRELRENIQRERTAEQARRTGELAQIVDTRNVNAFGRLADSVEAAISSMRRLQNQSETLSGLFEGTLSGGGRVNLGGDAFERLTVRDNALLQPLRLISGFGGVQGQRFADSANITRNLAQVLPDVIGRNVAQAIGTGRQDANDFVINTRRQLIQATGARPGSAAEDAVNSIIARLRAIANRPGGIRNVTQRAGSDITGFTDQLLSAYANPLAESGQRFLQGIETAAQGFIDGLTRGGRQLQAIGRDRDQLAVLRTQRLRAAREVGNVQNNRRGVGVLGLTLREQQAAAIQRLRRLGSGFIGGRAFVPNEAQAQDPRFIGRRLSIVQRQAVAAQQGRDAILAAEGPGQRFRQAANEFTRLELEAANLQTALRDLADVSNRNREIQERLNAIQRDQDSRISFGERFLRADAEGRSDINRGLLLARRASQTGRIDNLGREDRVRVLDTLRSLGDTRLTGFRGQPIASDLLRQLVTGGAARVFGLDPQRAAEQRNLRGQAVNNFDTAIAAQRELIQSQQALSQNFFQNLTSQLSTFLNRLQTLFEQDRLQDARNRIGQAQQTLGDLTALQRPRSLLAQLGITTQEQLERARPAVGQIRSEVARQRENRRTNEATERLLRGDNLVNLQREIFGRLRDRRAQDGPISTASELFSADVQQRLIRESINQGLSRRQAERFTQRFSNFLGSRGTFVLGRQSERDIFSRSFRQIFESAGERERERQQEEGVEPRRDIRARGINLDALDRLIGRGVEEQDFTQIFNAFDGTVQSLQTFDQALRVATQNVGAAQAAFQQLQAQIANRPPQQQPVVVQPNLPQVQQNASGGRILQQMAPGTFRPRGTDTVPAMLTPNEFVVNARSAQANLPLLRQINSASGPVFLQEGGLAQLRANLFRRRRQEEFRGVDLSGPRAAVGTSNLRRSVALQEGLVELGQGVFRNRARDEDIPLFPERGVVNRGLARDNPFRTLTEAEQEARRRRQRPVQLAADNPLRNVGLDFDVANFEARRQGAARQRDRARARARARTEAFARRFGLRPAAGRQAAGRQQPQNRVQRAIAGAIGRQELFRQRIQTLRRRQFFGNLRNFGPGARGFANINQRVLDLAAQQDEENRRRQANRGGLLGLRFQEGGEVPGFAGRSTEERLQALLLSNLRRSPRDPRLDLSLSSSPAGTRFALNEDQENIRDFGAAAFFRGTGGVGGGATAIGRQNGGPVPGFAGRSTQERLQALLLSNLRRSPRDVSLGISLSNSPASTRFALSEEQEALRDFGANAFFGNSIGGVGGGTTMIGRARGGRVHKYAEGGVVTRAGVDNVPAMLTTGEYVLNRSTTARIGVNNLNRINRFADGGLVAGAGGVQYLQNGGNVQGFAGGGRQIQPLIPDNFNSDFDQSVNTFGQHVGTMDSAFAKYATSVDAMDNSFTQFAGATDKLATALTAFPGTLTISGSQDINVNINGAEALAAFSGSVETLVTNLMNERINELFRDVLPDLGVNLE